MMNEKTCWTPDGQMGRCGSVRSCYPHVKLPSLSNLETWVLGTRGTCHYVEPDGRNVRHKFVNNFKIPRQFHFKLIGQFYGLCCPRTDVTDEIVFPAEKPPSNAISAPIDSDSGNKQARGQCGRGPFRILTLDEQSRIVGGQDAVPNGWKFIVRFSFEYFFKKFKWFLNYFNATGIDASKRSSLLRMLFAIQHDRSHW